MLYKAQPHEFDWIYDGQNVAVTFPQKAGKLMAKPLIQEWEKVHQCLGTNQ